MPEIEFSIHAKYMLNERKISEEWVWRVLNNPDKKIPGRRWKHALHQNNQRTQGTVLHVVINPNYQPNRIVTLFFDRRLAKPK